VERDLLGLDPEAMRKIGYQTIDLLIEFLDRGRDAPAIRRASRAEMEQRLREPEPRAPQEYDAILDQLGRDVLPFMSRTDHPGYFAFIPGFGTWPAAMGDLIASACNIYNGSWQESAGPSEIELIVLDWFKEWIGYPPEASGVLVSGGSAANMTALACARETLLGAMSDRVVVYVSDQAHSSMARAARVLGFRPDQVRVLPVDSLYRLRPETLEAAMNADRRAGRQPLMVVANAGSTNTGAIDPLDRIAALCREQSVWLHVDAAYGGFAALTVRGRQSLAGIELADSVTLDPHKWLYQPFECGCLLVREGGRLRQAFEITPDYLQDAEVAGQEVNFADLGIQLSRMCRALKVWMSLKFFGVDAFRDSIDRCLDLAALAQEHIEGSDELELLNPATLSVICFRRRPAGVVGEDELSRINAGLIHDLVESGQAMVSSTRLHGRYAIRMCIVNHTSTRSDVLRVLDWLERAPVSTAPIGETQVPAFERDPAIGLSQLERRSVHIGLLQSIALFASLSDRDLELVAVSAHEVTASSGDVIVRQWDVSRDFYVVLEGTATVWASERRIADIGPGDFFGELAALEWGTHFSYPRLASVVASSPLRLLVLSNATFQTLMGAVPDFGNQIRRAMRDRLPRM
jgi:aromatic-L-amino-acid decarboxylase